MNIISSRFYQILPLYAISYIHSLQNQVQTEFSSMFICIHINRIICINMHLVM